MKQNNMLGKDGLTITSANHLANIAKEMYEALVSKLSSLRFFSRDYMLAIAGKTFRVGEIRIRNPCLRSQGDRCTQITDCLP